LIKPKQALQKQEEDLNLDSTNYAPNRPIYIKIAKSMKENSMNKLFTFYVLYRYFYKFQFSALQISFFSSR